MTYRDPVKILIVDSDPQSSRKLEQILSETDFIISIADSINKAVSLIRGVPDIKAIISEISMSDGDVMAILKYIGGDSRLSLIPVLICSSSRDEKLIIKYVQAGAKDYLIKPVNANTLVSKMAKLINKTQSLILIVDDDKYMRNYLSRSVEREGFKALTATNGKEALELLNSFKDIKAVISDIEMPEVDGFELLARVKAEFPGIPVLLITGHGGKYAKKGIIAAGA
ncbi:MAG: response regulator, partial [candidate division Zixibacteria bacterium]